MFNTHPPDKFDKHLGKKIRTLRLNSNLSQRKLSIEMGYSKGYIAQVESGKIQIKIKSLYKIARYFDMDLDFFVEDFKDSD